MEEEIPTKEKSNIAGSILIVALVIALMAVAWGIGYFMGNEQLQNSKPDTAFCNNDKKSGETFFATIDRIENESILVSGLSNNDLNFQTQFYLHTDDNTIFEWRCTGINITDLEAGNIVKVTFRGAIAESYPAQIGNVIKVELLNSEI